MGAIPKADSRQLSARPGDQVPPLIVRVLADEQLYRDGAPTWPGAPTSNNAKKARKSYIKRLKRFSPQLPEAAKLAKILARCKRRRRCASGACPECGRAFQRFFVSEVKDLASNESLLKLTAVSIAFPRHRTADDKLDTLNTTKMKRDVTETIKDSDLIHWMAGGIDLSLNDDTQKNHGVVWQPQFYGFADVTSREVLSKVLRDRFIASKPAPRPVQTKECDGSTRALSYAFKTEFVRRIAYRATVGPPENRRKCWHTRKVSLRPSEHVRAMLWLHRIGLAGRLFLRGVRMTRTGNSVSLVQLKAKKLE